MAHKVLIGGTGYEIKGGRTLIGGTGYDVKGGKTLIGGTGYDISFNNYDWGDETAIGDAAWWAGLKAWLPTATASQRAALVGKKKKVSLSRAVLGASAASMVCIGSDCDGENTLVFQTEGVLPNRAYFGTGSSERSWPDSRVQRECNNFATYCSASASLKSVSKGYIYYTTSTTVSYTAKKAWLLSEREIGLDNYCALRAANSTTSNAECTRGYNLSYPYYNSSVRRVKRIMDANGNVGSTAAQYWLRTRNGNVSGYRYCVIATGGGEYYQEYDPDYNSTPYVAPAFVIG